MATLVEIYEWFMTGKKPTQAQFWASWGSFWNKSEQIPQSSISGLPGVLNAKAEKSQFDAHKTDENAHAALFAAKADAQALLNHIQATFEAIGIELQSRVYGDESLQFQIDDTNGFVSQARSDIEAINTLLTSDDINLDTVQEIVDAIKTVETSLGTILVNDLTTGGTTKALTAEMGKTLKGLIDGLVVPTATDTVRGIVKTDTMVADPVVYTTETTDNLLKAKVNAILEIKPITGIAYTLIAYDTENLVQLAYDGTLPMTVTIPNDATLNLPVGSIFYTVGSNTGALTIAGGSGVTFQTAVGLTAGQNETRKYVKKAANTWQVEGGVAATGANPLHNIAYVDCTFGNNSTAQIGNSSKPYLTVDAAITALSTDLNYNVFKTIEFINSGTYYVNNTIPDRYNYLFTTRLLVTLSWLNNTNSRVPEGIWAGQWFFDMPYSILEFSSNTGKYWSNNSLNIRITCLEIKVNTNSTVNRVSNLKCHKYTCVGSSGMEILDNSFIDVNLVTNSGASGIFIAWCGNNSIIEFNSMTTDANNFAIIGDGISAIIKHGNYTTASTATLIYIGLSSLIVTIEYKNATIIGNVCIGSHNTTNRLTVSGTCEYKSTSLSPFYRLISGNNMTFTANKLIYKGVSFLGGFGYTNATIPNITIIDSYIEIASSFYSNNNTVGTSSAYATPLVKLKGHNTIYCTSSGADYIKVNGSSVGNTIDVIGTLKTNGVLHSSVTQNNILP